MARAPIGGLMDTNVPSQLDEADLSAELELEIPDSQEAPLVFDSDIAIEIVEEDDGGVLVDFDPSDGWPCSRQTPPSTPKQSNPTHDHP